MMKEQKLSWTDARESCKHKGGDLASISSQAINDRLLSMEVEDDFWIGLNDKENEGSYVWASGDPFGPYTNWQVSPVPQPNAASSFQDYVKVRGGDGGWDDVSGGSLLKYACQISLTDAIQYDVASPLILSTRTLVASNASKGMASESEGYFTK